MQNLKRLFWLEYSPLGGPLIITPPFEAVGFDVKENGFWQPNYSDVFTDRIFPRIENAQPNLIVFLMMGKDTKEPSEWIKACQLIRENSNLHHTKIMAILGSREFTPIQKTVWDQQYDFFTKLPFKVIEYARIAKQLMGEQLKGFEGINYYLSLGGQSSNGNWSLQDYLVTHLTQMRI